MSNTTADQLKTELEARYPQANVAIQGSSLIVTVTPANLAEWRKWRDHFDARLGTRTGDDITVPGEYKGSPLTLIGRGVGHLGDMAHRGVSL